MKDSDIKMMIQKHLYAFLFEFHLFFSRTLSELSRKTAVVHDLFMELENLVNFLLNMVPKTQEVNVKTERITMHQLMKCMKQRFRVHHQTCLCLSYQQVNLQACLHIFYYFVKYICYKIFYHQIEKAYSIYHNRKFLRRFGE